MPSPDLVIFDCDGVLVDSEPIAARAGARVLAQAGHAIDPEDLARDYAGLTFKDILLTLERELGVPFQASMIDAEERLTDEMLAREVTSIPGAMAAVVAVTGRKCVCSNSRGDRIRMTLGKTGILPLFGDAIFSSLETPSGRPKPAPDVFLFAAEKMRARPAATFVIEDSVHGVRGARAAGMRVIGFTGAGHSQPGHADALTEAGAETVIRRMADLAGTLAALAEWSEDA